jgi:hypothetical protein
MPHYRFVEPVVLESDIAHHLPTLNKRRHRFTNERVIAIAEGKTVRFNWRGASWSVERRYLAQVMSD